VRKAVVKEIESTRHEEAP